MALCAGILFNQLFNIHNSFERCVFFADFITLVEIYVIDYRVFSYFIFIPGDMG